MKMRAGLFIAGLFVLGKKNNRKEPLKRIRSGVLGLALSLVPLVVVFELAQGMIEGISSRLIELSSYHMQVSPMERDGAADIDDLKRIIDGSNLVSASFRETNGLGLLRSETNTSSVAIRGVEAGIMQKSKGFAQFLRIVEGNFTLNDPKDLVIGEVVQKKLKLKVGDSVSLLTYSSGDFGGLPRVSNFVVRGVVSSGYQELDKLWVFVNFERGRSIISPTFSRTFLGLTIEDPFELPNAMRPNTDVIHQANETYTYGEYKNKLTNFLLDNWYVDTWYEIEEGQLSQYLWTKDILVLIMIIVVVVASFNVLSVMILLVVDKQEDIALLRSMGARPFGLSLSFLFMGALIGGIGSIIGLGLGALVSVCINQVIYVIELVTNGISWFLSFIANGFDSSQFTQTNLLNPEFYLENIPIKLHPETFLLIGLFTIILSIIASMIPSFRASRIRPMDIFRRV